MKTATKVIKFDYAHRLMGTDGELYDKDKCGSIHGHTGRVEITVKRNSKKYGAKQHDDRFEFVTDFSNFSGIRDWIDDNIDHATVISNNDQSLLNFCKDENLKYFKMPPRYNCANSENMIEVFRITFEELLPDYVRISRIKFYETPTSYIEWSL